MSNHYYINTSILSNDFTGKKRGIISEINGHYVESLSLYPIKETKGMLPVQSGSKQQLAITFECDAENYYLKLFSSMSGFTFASHEKITFMFANGDQLTRGIPVEGQGKFSQEPMPGYYQVTKIDPVELKMFRDNLLSKVLIKNETLHEPAMIMFNPTFSPVYATAAAGSIMLTEMANLITKARLKICHEEGVAMEYGSL